MFTYVLRRLMLMIPTLFGISLLVFTLTQIVPGGPERFMQQCALALQGILVPENQQSLKSLERSSISCTALISPHMKDTSNGWGCSNP